MNVDTKQNKAAALRNTCSSTIRNKSKTEVQSNLLHQGIKYNTPKVRCLTRYDSFSDVPESWVWWRADFQSGPRVLKKVFWTFSYLYLWHKMWFHAKKLLKTLKFWKSLNSLCKSGSRPQQSPKKSPKNRSLNRNLLKFLNRYGMFWVPPGESSCPDGSEYVWQRGVEKKTPKRRCWNRR